MTQAWKHQKILQSRAAIPTPEETKKWLASIGHARNRFLLTALYLTAGRVREVIGLTKENITTEFHNGKEYIIVDMMNEKNRRRKRKRLPISKEREGVLSEIFLTYISGLEGTLFTFKTRQRAHQICRKYGVNPHWLRHLRLTHLVMHYDFNDQLLTRFAGWTSSVQAKHYIEFRMEDFLRRL